MRRRPVEATARLAPAELAAGALNRRSPAEGAAPIALTAAERRTECRKRLLAVEFRREAAESGAACLVDGLANPESGRPMEPAAASAASSVPISGRRVIVVDRSRAEKSDIPTDSRSVPPAGTNVNMLKYGLKYQPPFQFPRP